jgi:small-conductance mechanosensitive channel
MTADSKPDLAQEGGVTEAGASAAVESHTSKEAQSLALDIDVGQFLPETAQPAWILLQDFPVLLVVLLLVLGYLMGKAIQFLVIKVLVKAAGKTATDIDDHLVALLAKPAVITMVTLALMAAITALNIPEGIHEFSLSVLASLLLISWGRVFFNSTHVALKAMSKYPDRFKAFQPRTVPLIEMGIKLFLLTAFVWIFMAIWGIDATAWLASAGIIGIAVGFAARDTLANLISGVSIVADAPYKIGDYIVLDTGERGMVSNLGIRSTRLVTRDDVEISIPNAVIGNAKITNESGGPWIKHRIRMPVGVAYGSDTDKVVAVLEQVAVDNPDVLSQPAPRVRMRAFGASSLDFELLGWIDYPEMRGRVKHEVLMEIDRRFRTEGIEIPFPQTDVHIRKDPD